MDKYFLIERVAFKIGDFEVYWYGIIMCLAIVAAIVVATVFCKLRNYEMDTAVNVALIAVPCGILVGRLFSVLFDENLSISEYFNFRTGGLSIIGSIIGGGIALAVYSYFKKDKDIFKYFDVICSVLLLAQAIGRWGNYFNSEVYGQLIDSKSVFAKFPFAVKVDGEYYQALFLYESILDLIGFFFTAEIFVCIKNATGYTTGFYLMYYGTVRTILERFRQDEYILKWGSVKVSMLFSILMIIAGIIVFVIAYNLRKKRNKAKRRR